MALDFVSLTVLASASSSSSAAPELNSVAAERKPALRAGGRACARGARERAPATLLALAALAFAAAVAAPRGESAEAPLARLADSLADGIVAAARGRAVEIAAPEDRTVSGGSLALDLQSLLRARLEGRVRLSGSGPRLRVDSVLAESPGRLWVSARLTEEPAGRLVDVLASSAEADPMLLSLIPAGPVAGTGPLAVVASRRTPPVEGRVLDLALVGEERVLVLFDDALALYRVDDAGLALLSRRELPGPLEPVRFPGGTIVLPPAEAAAWVLTSRSPRARLYGFDGGRLEERQQADALPWPRTPGGLRYRPGTNLIDAAVEDLGEGPFLRLDARGIAITTEGRLRMASAEGGRTLDVRAGGALARLGAELLAVSAADPPGPRDGVMLLDARDPARPAVQTLPMDGPVRALAGRAADGRMRLAAAVEEERGTHLVLIDLAPLTP